MLQDGVAQKYVCKAGEPISGLSREAWSLHPEDAVL